MGVYTGTLYINAALQRILFLCQTESTLNGMFYGWKENFKSSLQISAQPPIYKSLLINVISNVLQCRGYFFLFLYQMQHFHFILCYHIVYLL